MILRSLLIVATYTVPAVDIVMHVIRTSTIATLCGGYD